MASGLFLDIIPRILGLTEEMQRSAVGPAEAGGAEAGASYSRAFARTATAGTSGVTAGIQSQVRAAQAAVEQSSVAISAARDKEMASADRVLIAETKLAEARAKYAAGSSQVVAGEARLEAARRGQVTAAERLALAEANEGRAKTELIARADALAAAEGRQAEAATVASGRTDAAAARSQAAFGKLALGVAAAGTLIGVLAVKQAGDFQVSLTKLATTAGEAQGSLKGVGQGILDMAGQVGFSAQELAKAMYTVDSSGIHGADSLLVLKAAAQGAAQEQADLGHVTDAVTTALHDYHLPASDAALVTSQLITAVSHGKTTFDELTGAMHSVTPIASAAGISLAEASGALSAMTASGMSADQAAQNLGSTIKGLSAPTLPVIKMLGALGLSAADLSKNLGKNGVAGTLQIVSEAILKSMGPAGTTMLSTMNQSKLAGIDANKMYDAMAPKVRKVADELVNGTITTRQFSTGTGKLNAAMQAQGRQWLKNYKDANSFSQILRSGSNDSLTYMGALKKATGTTDGMAVALQVTGENAANTNRAIKDIAAATTQADGNIKGWDEVQGNFNQKLHQTIDMVKSWVIELGQRLLPAATTFIASLQTAGQWMSQHATLMRNIGTAILGVIAVMAIYKTVMIASALATKAMTLVTEVWRTTVFLAAAATTSWADAQAALDTALLANPIGIIIVSVTALVAAVIYAYTHFQTFRDVVDAVWDAIKTASLYVWNSVLKPTLEALGTALVAVGKWGMSMWQEYIKPAFTAVGAIVVWLWDNIVRPYLGLVMDYFKLLGSIYMGTFNNVIKPMFELFFAIVKFAWEVVVRPIFGLIGNFFRMEMLGMRIVYDQYVKPMLDAFGAAVRALWAAYIQPAIQVIMNVWTALGAVVGAVWNNVLRPVLAALGNTVRISLADAFRSGVSAIGVIWNGLQELVKIPIRFVVQTVLNNGLIAGFNDLASFFHTSKIPNIPLPAGFATGGSVWGAGTGTSDSIFARLSHGEFVVKESVASQNRPLLEALNNGGGYADGGSVPGFSLGGVVSGIGSAIGSAVSTAGSVIGDIVGAISDPVGTIRKLVDKLMGGMGAVLHSPFGEMLVAMPKVLLEKAADAIKGLFAPPPVASSGGGSRSFGGGGGAEQWRPIVDQVLAMLGQPLSMDSGVLSLIMSESGGNPNAINNWDSNAAAGHPSQGLMQTIPGTFMAYAGPFAGRGITDPLANIYAGVNYALQNYGSGMLAGGGRHSPTGGYVGYDDGGYMMPGVPALNSSTRPEPVFSASQWDVLRQNIRGGDGPADSPKLVQYITQYNPIAEPAAIAQNRALQLAGNLGDGLSG